MALAGELRQLLDDHRPRGHVDAEREGLGGEHHLDQPGRERLFHRFLHRRHHPGVVGGEAGFEPGEPAARSAAPRGRRRRARRSSRSAIARISARSAGSVRRSPAARHCSHRLVAAGAAEHERDRRAACSSASSSSTVSTRLGRAQRRAAVGRRAARVARRRRARRAGRRRGWVGARPFVRSATNVGSRCSVSRPRSPTRYRCSSVTGRCSSMTAAVRAAHRLDPGGDLLGVRHRGRQAHQPTSRRRGGRSPPPTPGRGSGPGGSAPRRARRSAARRAPVTPRRSCCAAPRWSSPRSARRR